MYRIDPCMTVLMDLESRGRRPRVVNPLGQSNRGLSGLGHGGDNTSKGS